MVYMCNNCHFLFSRIGEVDRCPDCGKETIRKATEQEEAEFKKQLEEAKSDPL